jgi:Domain of unknown function (DUF4258)
MTILDRIHVAIREGWYVFTDHAVDEAQADNLLLQDVIDVLLNGDLDSTYTEDERGIRYIIRGDVDEDEVDVVCRFGFKDKILIIITVYRVY